MSGKYRDEEFGKIGAVTFRSKAAYGRTISTVGPPVFWFPRVRVMLGFKFNRFSCVDALIR